MATKFLAIATLAACSLLGASADQTAVLAALDQFNQAARTGDSATLDKLLADDLIYAHSNARVETKAECIAALLKSKSDFKVAPGATVNVYGNTAVLHTKVTAHNPTGQIPLDMIQVWVKSGRNWRMVARHTARLPQQ